MTVPELLGAKIENTSDTDKIAEQLFKINEQLAVRNRRSRRIWKAVGIVLALIVIFQIVALLLFRTVTTEPDIHYEATVKQPKLED